MPYLQVPGALLYYETFSGGDTNGNSPLLLLIPGGDGRGSVFHEIARILAEGNLTVVCWDRRGYSKSLLQGKQDFGNRLSTDVDDARRLIEYLSPASLSEEKENNHGQQEKNPEALVFGTSSGAVVAQNLLIQYPQRVKALYIHEPPCFGVLRDEETVAKGEAMINHVYDTYRTYGPDTAMELFTAIAPQSDEVPMKNNMDARFGDEIRANSLFWFEFEMRQYSAAAVDLETLVREKEKIIPVAGVDSGDGPVVRPVATIARAMDKEISRLPGGHVGYMVYPEKFVEAFMGLLKERL